MFHTVWLVESKEISLKDKLQMMWGSAGALSTTTHLLPSPLFSFLLSRVFSCFLHRGAFATIFYAINPN
jgi:hypothetical protein